MSTRLFGLVLATILLASFQPAQAQQPKKVPRDLSLELAMPTILGRVPRHSGEGYEISVILRGKTSRLSIATLRERANVTQVLWRNSWN
jgi:hypothetical protein